MGFFPVSLNIFFYSTAHSPSIHWNNLNTCVNLIFLFREFILLNLTSPLQRPFFAHSACPASLVLSHWSRSSPLSDWRCPFPLRSGSQPTTPVLIWLWSLPPVLHLLCCISLSFAGIRQGHVAGVRNPWVWNLLFCSFAVWPWAGHILHCGFCFEFVKWGNDHCSSPKSAEKDTSLWSQLMWPYRTNFCMSSKGFPTFSIMLGVGGTWGTQKVLTVRIRFVISQMLGLFLDIFCKDERILIDLRGDFMHKPLKNKSTPRELWSWVDSAEDISINGDTRGVWLLRRRCHSVKVGWTQLPAHRPILPGLSHSQGFSAESRGTDKNIVSCCTCPMTLQSEFILQSNVYLAS